MSLQIVLAHEDFGVFVHGVVGGVGCFLAAPSVARVTQTKSLKEDIVRSSDRNNMSYVRGPLAFNLRAVRYLIFLISHV